MLAGEQRREADNLLGYRGGMGIGCSLLTGARVKFVEPRPYADLEAAARNLVEIASAIEPVQNSRIYIELVNAPFLNGPVAVPTSSGQASTARSPKACAGGRSHPGRLQSQPAEARSATLSSTA